MRGQERFDTTRWSVVQAAGAASAADAQQALQQLCESYWYPLYGYVRRQGYSAEDAADLTQAFFALLIERRDVASVSRERGTFRSFLLAALRHFLLNDIVRRGAMKRGGHVSIVSIDVEAADSRFHQDPLDADTPERIFDRQWARALLDRVMAHLRRDWRDAGKLRDFDALAPCLAGEKPAGGYAAVAAGLGSTEGAVKVTAHRLRRQFQQRLRDEIAQTLSADGDVEDEIRYLLRALQP